MWETANLLRLIEAQEKIVRLNPDAPFDNLKLYLYSMLMTWNYRIIKKLGEGEDLEEYYDIHEVYYNSEGKIAAASENPQSAYGENVEEVRDCLSRMLEACDKPILIESEIEYASF